MAIVLAAALLVGGAGSLFVLRRSAWGWLGVGVFGLCLLVLAGLLAIEKLDRGSPEDVESQLSEFLP